MIKKLATRYRSVIAAFFFWLFSLSLILPVMATGSPLSSRIALPQAKAPYDSGDHSKKQFLPSMPGNAALEQVSAEQVSPNEGQSLSDEWIDGPGQPEMASFKSVGTGNMVNLFTGDFSYNIPLMDVGGYPVNIFYSGGIGPEQEASWVGLGWNINPGNINRNMRGVPDDFNGKDTMQQMQVMKPNKTWGVGVGGDLELLGQKGVIKDSMNFSLKFGAKLGVAFNNYLGPSLDLALRGNAGYKISAIAATEKLTKSAKTGKIDTSTGMALAINPSVSVGIDINSRAGASFSGGVSLMANAMYKGNSLGFGGSLSTGYNSRTGIKGLQIAEQLSFSQYEEKKKGEKEPNPYGSLNPTLHANTISFLKPSYTPALRMPVTNTAWSGHFQLGLGSWGVAADVEAEVYGQKSEVEAKDTLQKKPMVGYLYYQQAVNNPHAVMDFTRFNDKEITPNTPVISVPQYSYDVFSIQGEGTGGSIRAYRNDLGYVRDNTTVTKDRNISLGADIDPPGHYGANFNIIKSPSKISEWNNGNRLRNSIQFAQANGKFENVYFRNPAESCVIDSTRFEQVGGIDLVRFVLGGTGTAPSLEPRLQRFDKALKPNSTLVDVAQRPVNSARNSRTQVTSFLTAEEAAVAGLDKTIKSYNNQTFLSATGDTLIYESIPRVSSYRKAHHLSQINVTEANGRRYIYGVPVYNVRQKDFVFSVDNSYSEIPDKVLVKNDYLSAGSSLLKDKSSRDGYLQITTTPAYAHSFLLSGILSPDYVDVTGNGITEDDLGDAVKFNYSRIKSGNDTTHKWRTPLTAGDSANFNAGLRSEIKDDKGIISYGERESWYLQSIESKTMIALFFVSDRLDGKGASGERGGIYSAGTLVKKLDSIALYSKADLRKNDLTKAKPIKTVHFTYTYALCQNTPDNPTGTTGSRGKLTLESIYSTFNGKTRAVKNKYKFTYDSPGTTGNPHYSFAASDRWGGFKPAALNPSTLKNNDYPYSAQYAGGDTLHQYASAWMLRKIQLPSGGEMEVSYESDDYAFVQNKRAAQMMRVIGFNNSASFSTASNWLYRSATAGSAENDYVFMRVPVACTNATDAFNKYLSGISQLAFRVWVQMPKGPEYITCYAGFGTTAGVDYGVDASNATIIWVKMKRLGGKSPLSITTLEYLRQQLPGQAFRGYDVSGEPGLKQVGEMLMGMLFSLRDAFSDPVNAFRKDGKAMRVDTARCFVRLNDPDGFKYGGGHRVKSVVLKDNWNVMTKQYTSTYGQKYDYTTTENFNGATRRISSGVASYEPAIGGEENPFQSIMEIEDYLPLGPTSYGAIEMPVLDAFFPAPSVGYSKITVSSIRVDTAASKKSRSGIGKQVTEFYTAKDFPVYYSVTPLDPAAVKEFHQASTTNFFNKYAYDFKALTQGFLVINNDMHGKMKSQSSYAANDSSTRISYTENFYRNTGKNGLNDKFTFIKKETGGTVYSGNMGVDIDLMTDAREFSVKASSEEYQGQVDVFYFGIPIPVPTIWPVDGITENIYRAVTTTKVVDFHAVLDSVVVIDKGSMVSTKNLAYDAQTGEVLVSRTNNEFNRPVYNSAFPAHWAYGGMGLAAMNIDVTYSDIHFVDGKISSPNVDMSLFESGDELLIKKAALPDTGCSIQLATPGNHLIWAYDKNKSNTSLTTTPDFIFLDAKGKPYTMWNVSFRIIRSGHRNVLDAKAATITSLVNPLATGKLFFDTASKVVNAAAVEYREKWQVDNDVIRKLKVINDPVTCARIEVEDSLGYKEKSINLYRKGMLGNFRSYRSMVFYDGRKEYDTTATTNIAENGFLKNFKPYWNFNVSNNLVPDTASTQWVWNSKLNKVNAKGLELETQDALGIYTSAQYGYDKTLPVAIAGNARFNEMFADGFEDYQYGESISNAQYNYRKRHIDFSKVNNAFLVNTDSTTFKAHTGKYVLGVNGTASLSIPLAQEPPGYANITAAPVGLPSVVWGSMGGNITYISSVANFSNTSTTFNTGNPLGGLYFTMQPSLPTSSISGNYVSYNYLINTKQYFEVSSAGTYTLKFRSQSGKENSSYSNFPAFSSIAVYDSANNITHIGTDLGTTSDTYSKTRTKSFCLDKGVYILILQFIASYSYSCTPGPYTSFCTTGGSDAYLVADNYSVMDANTPSTGSIKFYRGYSTVNYCTFTPPLAASDSMLHSLFSIPPGKKMVFSAWVRENCGNEASGIPCRENTYTQNQVRLQYSASPGDYVTLTPSGPIIDGWQRYEGVFTVPAGNTGVSLQLINNSASTIYYDDIRIHPYNANVKSYVYDPVNLRLVAELDANNYASFYEYDEEGTLIRTKAETTEGVKTLTETRSTLQKIIQ